LSVAARPAPLTPDLASMTTSASSPARASGDQRRLADRVAVQLGQPVDRLAEQLGMTVLDVVLLIDREVAQAEVGAQVHHLDPAGAQLRDDGRRGAVRVGDDRGVDLAVRPVEVQLLQHLRHAVARVERVQRRARVAARGDPRQREERMAVDDPRRQRARVAGRARDQDRCAGAVSHAAHRRPSR
jgi:hypothetical protein